MQLNVKEIEKMDIRELSRILRIPELLRLHVSEKAFINLEKDDGRESAAGLESWLKERGPSACHRSCCEEQSVAEEALHQPDGLEPDEITDEMKVNDDKASRVIKKLVKDATTYGLFAKQVDAAVEEIYRGADPSIVMVKVAEAAHALGKKSVSDPVTALDDMMDSLPKPYVVVRKGKKE